MKTVVFLGPSLPLDQALEILPDAIYLPPARQADLLSAVTVHQPRVIALIDGVFGQSLSVWHKEILFALKSGVAVYGASSMGALRAAECSGFGMIGVGQVYEWYASGQLNDDDEVALLHGDADTGYYNASEPMVNLRATFLAAAQTGIITDDECRVLIKAGKEIFYPERSLSSVLARAAEMGLEAKQIEAVRGFCAQGYVNLKARDASKCLRTIAALPGAPPKPAADFELTRSHFFSAQFDRDRWVERAGTRIALGDIASFAALHLPQFNRLNFSALNRALVVQLADLLKLEVEPLWVEEEQKRLCRRLGLKEAEDLQLWLADNDYTQEELTGLMTDMARCRRLHRWLLTTKKAAEGSTKLVLDEMRLAGLYSETASRAADQSKVPANQLEAFVAAGHSDMDLPDLVREHLTETEGLMDTHYLLWGKEAGFSDPLDLKFELLRSRNRRQVVKDITSLMFTDDDEEDQS